MLSHPEDSMCAMPKSSAGVQSDGWLLAGSRSDTPDDVASDLNCRYLSGKITMFNTTTGSLP